MNEETLQQWVSQARSDSFDNHFSLRVALALTEREARESSLRDVTNGLVSAFWRVSLTSAVAGLLCFLWISIGPNENRGVRATTLEQELDFSGYQMLEELI